MWTKIKSSTSQIDAAWNYNIIVLESALSPWYLFHSTKFHTQPIGTMQSKPTNDKFSLTSPSNRWFAYSHVFLPSKIYGLIGKKLDKSINEFRLLYHPNSFIDFRNFLFSHFLSIIPNRPKTGHAIRFKMIFDT
jgi:hypothetical protein